jgi:hypothetical protein
MLLRVNAGRFRKQHLSSWKVGVWRDWFGFVVGLLLLSKSTLMAGRQVDTGDPVQFFTNLASRLLQSDLNLELTRIQIWPTNQYTPAVHRLLQVTANIYDTTTNRFGDDFAYLPTVFRPLFTNDCGSIFICAYAEETGTNFLSRPYRDLDNPADRAALQPDDNVYGIPLVIGAKKGLPNFNEFALQSVIQVARGLEFRKVTPAGPVTQTNQMYIIGISNLFGIEGWNSYQAAYPHSLKMVLAGEVSMVMTNEMQGLAGVVRSNIVVVATVSNNILPDSWRGFVDPRNPADSKNAYSFLVPANGGCWFVTNEAYQPYAAGGGKLVGGTSEPEPQSVAGFPVPRLALTLRSRLRFALVDAILNRIVDYVNLSGMDANIDITAQLMGQAQLGVEPSVIGSLWNTNRLGNSSDVFTPTFGIINQIEVCLGNITLSLTDWISYGLQTMSGQGKAKAIDTFRVFMGYDPIMYPRGDLPTTNLVMQAPFDPARKVFQYNSWQANDPLVHYTVGDLTDLSSTNVIVFIAPPGNSAPGLLNIGKVNTRYNPWPTDPTAPAPEYNLALKDPLVTKSDDWDFPTNQPLCIQWAERPHQSNLRADHHQSSHQVDIRWLGRVHRGTPWQTIYLKSACVDLQTWMNWIGCEDAREASLSLPTNDWRLASLLVSLQSADYPCHLLSVNDPRLHAWRSVLDGMCVLTNTVSDSGFELNPFQPALFNELVMRSKSPQAAIITDAIARTRASQPNQRFHQLGDILSTPELSIASPWLNLSDIQRQRGITDEAYESIPAQLLPRLRPDSLGEAGWANGRFHVRFTGLDHCRYVVEKSTDLKHWVAVSTNCPANGGFDLTDDSPQDAPAVFYRSVLLP